MQSSLDAETDNLGGRTADSKFTITRPLNQIVAGEQSLMFDETVNIRILTHGGVQSSAENSTGDNEAAVSEHCITDDAHCGDLT